MRDREHALDELLDRTAEQIRSGRPDPAVASAALARVRQSLLAEASGASPSAADLPETIRGCADYQALIPAYLAGTLPEARRHEWTRIVPAGDRQWEVTQTLLDAEGDHDWGLRARVDLRGATAVDQPLLRLEWIDR